MTDIIKKWTPPPKSDRLTGMARGMLDNARGAGNLEAEQWGDTDFFVKYDGHWQSIEWDGKPLHDGHINALLNKCALMGAEG